MSSLINIRFINLDTKEEKEVKVDSTVKFAISLFKLNQIDNFFDNFYLKEFLCGDKIIYEFLNFEENLIHENSVITFNDEFRKDLELSIMELLEINDRFN